MFFHLWKYPNITYEMIRLKLKYTLKNQMSQTLGLLDLENVMQFYLWARMIIFWM